MKAHIKEFHKDGFVKINDLVGAEVWSNEGLLTAEIDPFLAEEFEAGRTDHGYMKDGVIVPDCDQYPELDA